MSKLNEIRKRVSNKIRVAQRLYIEVKEDQIELFEDKDCENSCSIIKDNEIKPLIKALQELIK